MKKSLYFSLSLVVVPLLFLGGCGKPETEVKKEAMPTMPAVEAKEVLLTVDGKAAVTVDDFEKYKAQFLDMQPQYKQIFEIMPDGDSQLFKAMADEKVLETWVVKNRVDQREDYKKDLDAIITFAKRNLAGKYFNQEHPVAISDADIKKFYEENKNVIPELMETPGGVTAKGVKFDKESDAKAFMDKVKAAGADFDKAAKDMNLKVENFGNVNASSYRVESPVRERLMDMKKFPTTEMISGDDGKPTFWVVKATTKVEAKYVPFDKIKSGLEGYLKQQKTMESSTKELEKLKSDYKAVENKDYFERKRKAREEAAKKMEDQAEQDGKRHPGGAQPQAPVNKAAAAAA